MGTSNQVIKELAKELKRARYDRLKAEGRLPQHPASGRGMPTDVSFDEWDGQTREEHKEAWARADSGRMSGW